MAASWYLIHTKPKQEKCALQNLENQGYTCYLPLLVMERIARGKITLVQEPLFPRYLFIALDNASFSKSWAPIRSTRGVGRLVSFGTEPASVDQELIDTIRSHEHTVRQQPVRIFQTGEPVTITEGPFTGVEALFQMADGERRALILIELLSKPVVIGVDYDKLIKQ